MVVVCLRLLYAFGVLFIFCEMGEQISSTFGEVEDEMYRMDWHLFPIKTQKMMLIVVVNAQQPVKIMGFGNIPAIRPTMKTVKLIDFFDFV